MLIIRLILDGWDAYGGLHVRSRRTQNSKYMTIHRQQVVMSELRGAALHGIPSGMADE